MGIVELGALKCSRTSPRGPCGGWVPALPTLSGSEVGAREGTGAALQPACGCEIPNISLTGASDLPNQRRDLHP